MKRRSKGIDSRLAILVIVLIACVAYSVYRSDWVKIPVSGTPTPVSPTSIILPSPYPTPTVIQLQVPDNKNWYEYKAACVALSKNMQIFFPAGWKTSVEQHVLDNVEGKPGSQEYLDSINLVSQCQVLAGYRDAPGGYQDPCLKNDYDVISVSAVQVNSGQDVEYWKNTYLSRKIYSSVTEDVLNGRKYLIVNGDDRMYTDYETIQNNYLISVSHNICGRQPVTNQDAYFKQTGFEVFKRLIFK